MSDPRASYGDPVREPVPADDDVVGRAHEGLADAEAAGRDATTERTDAEPAAYRVSPEDHAAEQAEPAASDPLREPEAAREPDPLREPEPRHEPAARAVDVSSDDDDDIDKRYALYAASADPDPTPTEAETVEVAPVATPVPTPVSTKATPAQPATSAAPQPIFVQAPEAPRPRGNRGAAGGIGLLAAIAFAILYLAAWAGIGFLNGDLTADNAGETILAQLTTFALWVPVVVFFLAFWLLGAFINRGRWGAWVIFGLLVGIASYGGHILGQLFQAQFWTLTASRGSALVEEQLWAPLAIAALVIGRELTIWFGAWVAARGKRVTELNAEAQREYERTLEAGPQLVRA